MNAMAEDGEPTMARDHEEEGGDSGHSQRQRRDNDGSVDLNDDEATARTTLRTSPNPPTTPIATTNTAAASVVAAQTQQGNLDKANRLLRLSKDMIEKLKTQLAQEKEETERVREEYQKYRVRSELAASQRDLEIAKLAEVNLKYRQYNVVSHDMQAELESLRRRFENVERERGEAQNEVTRLSALFEKERVARLQAEAESRGWRAEAEEVGPDMFEKVTLQLTDQLNDVRKEFRQFRELTANALEEKEKELTKARNSSEAATELAYLRDVILKYFASSNDPIARTSMEAAIATVLRFNKSEVEYVREKRKEDLGFLHRFY